MKIQSLILFLLFNIFSVSASADTASDIKLLITNNLKYSQEENLTAFMSTLHSQSPAYLPTQQGMISLFTNFALTYQLASYEFIAVDKEYAYAKIKQKTSKISGAAFRNNQVEALQVFKKESGQWKFWAQANLSTQYF